MSKERIKELEEERQKLIEVRVQHIQQVQLIEVVISEKNGAIAELKKLTVDKPKKKK